MRFAVALLVVFVAFASAVEVADNAIPATRLESASDSFSSGSSGSLSSGSLSLSASSSEGCGEEPACHNGNQHISLSGGEGRDAMGSVEDAIKPVDDWIKDFKKRASGSGQGLYTAAKAIVAPLLQKLKRQMKRAEEKLKHSNEEILAHVKEATTKHVYTLLKADNDNAKNEERHEEHAREAAEAKAKIHEAEERAKVVLGESSHHGSHHGSSHHGSSHEHSSVMSSIAKVLSQSSHAAAQSVASALSQASHSSTQSHHGSSSHGSSHHGSSSHHSSSQSH